MSKRKIIKKVTKILQADYGSKPMLYFCDTDGDQMLIKRYSDVRFALKSHNKQLRNASSSDCAPLLRLTARMGDGEMPSLGTLALSSPSSSSATCLPPQQQERRGESKDNCMANNQYAGINAGVTMEGDVLLQDDYFHWQKGI